MHGIYRSYTLKSRGSYGNSTFSKGYISLDFYVLWLISVRLQYITLTVASIKSTAKLVLLAGLGLRTSWSFCSKLHLASFPSNIQYMTLNFLQFYVIIFNMACEVESFLGRIVEPIEYLPSTTFVFRIRIEFIAYHFFWKFILPCKDQGVKENCHF